MLKIFSWSDDIEGMLLFGFVVAQPPENNLFQFPCVRLHTW